MAAVQALAPRFRQISAAVYHAYKHPEIPRAVGELPANFPHMGSAEEKYFALCEHVVKTGTVVESSTGQPQPAALGGHSIQFERTYGGETYFAVVQVSPAGDVHLLTMYAKR